MWCVPNPCPALPCSWDLPCAWSPPTLSLGARWHPQAAVLRVRGSEVKARQGEHAVLSPVTCHSHTVTKHGSCVARGHFPLHGGLLWGPSGRCILWDAPELSVQPCRLWDQSLPPSPGAVGASAAWCCLHCCHVLLCHGKQRGAAPAWVPTTAALGGGAPVEPPRGWTWGLCPSISAGPGASVGTGGHLRLASVKIKSLALFAARCFPRALCNSIE